MSTTPSTAPHRVYRKKPSNPKAKPHAGVQPESILWNLANDLDTYDLMHPRTMDSQKRVEDYKKIIRPYAAFLGRVIQ